MNFNNVNLLDIVEEYAEYNSLICSEESLSERFDEMLDESESFNTYDRDDTVAINEAFSTWSDGLCKDGEIHEEQYNNYCYVGKYS